MDKTQVWQERSFPGCEPVCGGDRPGSQPDCRGASVMESVRGSGASGGVSRGIHEVPAEAAATFGKPSPVSNPESLASTEWQRYADIIALAPHEPRSHPRMTRHGRAAQLTPYAPLTSFGKVLTDAALNGAVPGGDILAET